MGCSPCFCRRIHGQAVVYHNLNAVVANEYVAYGFCRIFRMLAVVGFGGVYAHTHDYAVENVETACHDGGMSGGKRPE